jgi:hypothetical protein
MNPIREQAKAMAEANGWVADEPMINALMVMIVAQQHGRDPLATVREVLDSKAL